MMKCSATGYFFFNSLFSPRKVPFLFPPSAVLQNTLSPRGEILHASGPQVLQLVPWVFEAVTQETFLYWLALMVSRACVPGSSGTVTKRDILGQLPLPEHKRKQTETGLLAYLPNCGLRGRLLIQHTPKGPLNSPATLEDEHNLYTCTLQPAREPVPSGEELVWSWILCPMPWFLWLPSKGCSLSTRL